VYLVWVLGCVASRGYWVRRSSASSDRWIHAVKSVYGLKVMNLIKVLC